jgi:hypothetical protein
VPSPTVNGHHQNLHQCRHVHVLDDDGKDRKMTITGKVAIPE